MSLSPMSYLEFKKWPCRPVDFRGQGPCRRRGVLLCLWGKPADDGPCLECSLLSLSLHAPPSLDEHQEIHRETWGELRCRTGAHSVKAASDMLTPTV